MEVDPPGVLVHNTTSDNVPNSLESDADALPEIPPDSQPLKEGKVLLASPDSPPPDQDKVLLSPDSADVLVDGTKCANAPNPQNLDNKPLESSDTQGQPEIQPGSQPGQEGKVSLVSPNYPPERKALFASSDTPPVDDALLASPEKGTTCEKSSSTRKPMENSLAEAQPEIQPDPQSPQEGKVSLPSPDLPPSNEGKTSLASPEGKALLASPASPLEGKASLASPEGKALLASPASMPENKDKARSAAGDLPQPSIEKTCLALPVAPVSPERVRPSATIPMYAPEVIAVQVGNEIIEADLKACACQAAAFKPVRDARKVRKTNGTEKCEVDFSLPDFPGGAPLLRSMLKYLDATYAEERAAAAIEGRLGVPAGVLKMDPCAFILEYDADNVGTYLEAAAVLKCPSLMRDAVLAPVAKELSSKRVLDLLERFLLRTQHIEPASVPGVGSTAAELRYVLPSALQRNTGKENCSVSPSRRHGSCIAEYSAGSGRKPATSEDRATPEMVVQACSQVIQRLCARLDVIDLRLTAALASGAPWACMEVLYAHRMKVQNVGQVNYAIQSALASVKALFYEEDTKKRSSTKKREWDEHEFALHVFRSGVVNAAMRSHDRHVQEVSRKAKQALEIEGAPVDLEGDGFSEVEVLPSDVESTDSESQEDAAAMAQLPQSSRMGADIPEILLDHASDYHLACLSEYPPLIQAELTPPVLCAAMIRSLLVVGLVTEALALFEAVFLRSKQARRMVTQGLIPFNFLAHVKQHRVASHVLRRLLLRHATLDVDIFCRLLTSLLFKEFRGEQHCLDVVLNSRMIVDVVVYCRVATRCIAEDALEHSGDIANLDLKRLRKAGERLFDMVFVLHDGFLPKDFSRNAYSESAAASEVECCWDSGDLDLQILSCTPDGEDALRLKRIVLLRGLFRRQSVGVGSDIPVIAKLWQLGRWNECTDAELVSEAFILVSSVWRRLHESKAVASWPNSENHGLVVDWCALEELVFCMFAQMPMTLLDPRQLMTPWMPPQVLAVHLAEMCKVTHEQQSALSEASQRNIDDVNNLKVRVEELLSKLGTIENRSLQSTAKQEEVIKTLKTLI